MSVLREAAHARHRMVSTACWWWCPPVHAVSQAVHARIVDGFYDALDGPAFPPFLLDDEPTKDRNLMILALILVVLLSRLRLSSHDH